jgi:hypothetical protein
MIDDLLQCSYSESFNCWDFALLAWERLTGKKLPRVLEGHTLPAMRAALDECKVSFKPIEAPISPCFVLFERNVTAPHIGVFYKGRVLHMNERGAFWVPISDAARGYQRTSYYTC